jgi:hypothetical protein
MGVVYVRRGSSTAQATPDEIARMGAAAATDAWSQKELEQQRRERDEHRQLQLRLHGDVNRPNVLCDFPIIHTVQYLRVKNYGTQPAKDVRIVPTAVYGEFPSIACLNHPISFLVPEDELVYWLYGPRDFHKLRNLTLKLSYSDLQGRQFDMEQTFDFNYLGTVGGGGRGVDIGRENNHPIVRALRRIAEVLGRGAKPTSNPFDDSASGGPDE